MPFAGVQLSVLQRGKPRARCLHSPVHMVADIFLRSVARWIEIPVSPRPALHGRKNGTTLMLLGNHIGLYCRAVPALCHFKRVSGCQLFMCRIIRKIDQFRRVIGEVV